MVEAITIARPYAQAVFRLAKDTRALDAWSVRLQRLAEIAQDPQMARAIDNPKLSPTQLAELFVSLSGEPGNVELVNFVGMLAENERFGMLPDIWAAYEQAKMADAGVKIALISSAYPLDDAQLKNLTREFEAHFGVRLEAQVSVDPNLIAGVKVTVGDQVLDLSVRGKLDAMAAALKN